MKNIVTAYEAFDALLNGFDVLCRPVGEVLDFAELGQFPATIFAMPGYEFCVKAKPMELAGFKFSKPLTPHDVEDQQEIYIVMPSRILRTKFDAENSEILCSVMNGFAQADAENAILQLKAIGATFGQVIDEVEVKEAFIDKPKKQRGKKEPQVKTEKPVIEETAMEIGKAINNTIVITEQTNVTTSEEPLTPIAVEPETDMEYQKTLDTLLQRVSESKTPAEVNAVYRYTRTWSEKQMEPLLQATHKRLTELADQKPVESEPPSLMVQIQNAPDLTTLDALEIDVASRALEIQPKLMGFVKKRRFELESAVVVPASEPDYLLGDYP